MKLAIVIVHYNTISDLDRCLESLESYPPAAAHKVVVVDNASQDEGLADVRDRHPDCAWILNPENAGYSRGANLGMAAVEAEFYLVLNPDIVVQPGALDRLLAFAEAHPRAGLIGPQLLNEDGTIQESCRRFYTFLTLLLRRTFLGRLFPDSGPVRRHLMRDFDHRSVRPVDWVLGGCVMVRRAAVDRTGPMDERFFLYFEDVDWCYRMWQAGWEVLYTPDARFVHRHRRASARRRFGQSWWRHLGSLISFYEKWGMLVWLLKKWRDPLLVLLLWTLDMTALTGAFLSAYALRSLLQGLFAEPLFAFAEYRPLLYFAWLLASVTFLLTGRYHKGVRRRHRPLGEHLQQIGVVAVLLLASTYLGHLDVVSRAVLLIFIPLLAATTMLAERLFRRLGERLEAGHLSLERTLLVGAPGVLQPWLSEARDLAAHGVDIAGYLADPADGSGMPPLGTGQVPWLGRLDEIVAVVQRYRVSQVVFWEGALGEDAMSWASVAGLRRLRVRLRWRTDEVWLLATDARPEPFGNALSAVQVTAGGATTRALGLRLASFVAGGLLALLGALPWLWLRGVKVARGRAALRRVAVSDLWGHDPVLTVAVDAKDRTLPLFWQWRLAGPLMAGSLGLIGPRPLTGGRRQQPRGPADVLAFWRHEPRAPGLTGDWAAGAVADGGGWGAALAQLWHHPCGFGELGPTPPGAVAADEVTDAVATRRETTENEVT